MVSLDDLISKAQELKPLPASAVRLASLVSSTEVSLDDICEVIAYDQALTLSLLRAANSAASGSARGISQVHEAVFRLGTSRTLALAIGASASGFLKRKVSGYALSEGALWRHSVAAAAAAENLVECSSVPLPPETFTAALLHDVGKLVMGRYLSEEDLELIHRAQTDGGLDPLAAESQILQVHHGELGGIIAQHWKLPERIVKGIIYHHTPSEGNEPICDAVYLSNLIAKSVEPDAGPVNVDTAVLERLGLSNVEVGELVSSTQSHFDCVHQRYDAV